MINKVDYTSLTGKETDEEIMSVCEKAIELGVSSVCVYPKWVTFVKNCLEDSNVKTCTVISFPKGNDSTIKKVYETMEALVNGADEIDMVIDYQKVIDNWDGDLLPKAIDDEISNDVQTVTDIVKGAGKTIKVILETGLLTNEQTEWLTELCVECGVDFVKTSTGKVSVGAEIEKVKCMTKAIDEDDVKIKASGGIRTLEDMELFDPYVDRFGMGYGSVDKIYLGKKSESEY
jgi:deoxyribose-phosphate aldolase